MDNRMPPPPGNGRGFPAVTTPGYHRRLSRIPEEKGKRQKLRMPETVNAALPGVMERIQVAAAGQGKAPCPAEQFSDHPDGKTCGIKGDFVVCVIHTAL
jgi:hypothetical protein